MVLTICSVRKADTQTVNTAYKNKKFPQLSLLYK